MFKRPIFLIFLAAILITACTPREGVSQNNNQKMDDNKNEMTQNAGTNEKIVKTDAEWRAELSDMEYYVTRQKGTERAFTGKYWDTKTKGTYLCVACGYELFDSDTKYKSGSGWPSFYQPVDESHVVEHTDRSLGMARTEVVCARCDAHLGHVFNDGPRPTGLRYCINSASLELREEKDEK